MLDGVEVSSVMADVDGESNGIISSKSGVSVGLGEEWRLSGGFGVVFRALKAFFNEKVVKRRHHL